MQQVTKDLAKRYRELRDRYFEIDLRATPRDELHSVQLAYQIAAHDLASAVLAEIDQNEH